MKLTSRESGTVRVLTVAGRIDHASTPAFEQALAPHLADCGKGFSTLALDFGEVDYISSIGLRALILAYKQVAPQNGRIVIAALTPNVAEVFNISRLNMVFRLYDTVETAIVEARS